MSELRSKCCGAEVHWEQTSYTSGKTGGEWRCGRCLKLCEIIEVEEKKEEE